MTLHYVGYSTSISFFIYCIVLISNFCQAYPENPIGLAEDVYDCLRSCFRLVLR